MPGTEKHIRNRKKLLIVAVILLGVCMAVILLPTKEQRILQFVRKNLSELEEIASACLDGGTIPERYHGAKVEGAFEGEHTIVSFSWVGFGIAPYGWYYGFYYSPEDVPVATAFFMNCEGYAMSAGENGEWMWEEEDGDNGCLVTKVADHWYCYKAWF